MASRWLGREAEGKGFARRMTGLMNISVTLSQCGNCSARSRVTSKFAQWNAHRVCGRVCVCARSRTCVCIPSLIVLSLNYTAVIKLPPAIGNMMLCRALRACHAFFNYFPPLSGHSRARNLSGGLYVQNFYREDTRGSSSCFVLSSC